MNKVNLSLSFVIVYISFSMVTDYNTLKKKKILWWFNWGMFFLDYLWRELPDKKFNLSEENLLVLACQVR